MNVFLKSIKEFLRSLAMAFAWGIAIILGTIILFKISPGKTSQADYKIRYDSLRYADSIKQVIIIGQIKVRKELEHKNDSLAKILKAHKYYKKHKISNVTSSCEQIIKQFQDVVADQKKQIVEKDSLIAKVINDCNLKNP